jgi:hypothetical protein
MENAAVLTSKEKRNRRKNLAISRVGETRINNFGSLMIVEEYNSSSDILVRFKDGNMVKTSWQCFITGSVKNVYDRSVFGVGFIGEGKYKPSVNGEPTPQYKVWYNMILRCYSKSHHEKNPTYKDCLVAPEWHNFQTFAKWYDENFYEVEGHRMHLDKDILFKGNKLYSPETCVFVPQFINSLFLKRDKLRGDMPIGVKVTSRYDNKYEARCCENKGRTYLGTFDCPIEAFQKYKEYKEELIKSIAIEYKSSLPTALINAMLSYIVEIND